MVKKKTKTNNNQREQAQ